LAGNLYSTDRDWGSPKNPSVFASFCQLMGRSQLHTSLTVLEMVGKVSMHGGDFCF
jgi:hypothetical protein